MNFIPLEFLIKLMIIRSISMRSFAYLLIVITCSACFTSKFQPKSGTDAYDLRQYAKAIPLFLTEYEEANDRETKGIKSYYLAKSYQRVNDNTNALKWYERAVQNEFGLEAYRNLAFAYKKEELYDRAIQTFQLWQSEGGSMLEANREIGIIKQAKQWLKGDKSVVVQELSVNTTSAEYSPVIYDERYLVFSSDRMGSTGSSKYEWTGNQYSDLYIASKSGSEPILFDDTINTEHNEGVACFNQDFTEIFFTRCYDEIADDHCKLLVSVREGNGWSNPKIVFPMLPNVNYGHPTLVESDSVLIFSSNDPSGYGEYDLYYSFREEEGIWSDPELMPESINTQGNEQFPRSDGDTLYFASDYLPGMGGLDIFKTYLMAGGTWSAPVNVGAPINSGADDFSLIIDRRAISTGPNLKQGGFFSSSRAGTGDDDIYQFSIYELEEEDQPEPVIVEEEETPDNEKRIYIAVRVVENILSDPENPNSEIIGKEGLSESEILVNDSSENVTVRTDAGGRIIMDGTESTTYSFKVSRDGYLTNSKTLTTESSENLNGSKTYNVEIALDKIYYNKEIILENIYYDFNKFFIRDDAKPSLDTLIQLLNDNPSISILLASHTDCVGRPEYNMELSDRRALSAVDYIASKGISPSRLAYKGFGESRLVVECICQLCTEEQNQKNRRTTFTILED